MSREWLTPAEAAGRLSVDRHTIYDGVADGTIPARRVGRSVRIPVTWVDGADLNVDTGRATPDVERFAAEFARAVAVELGRLLGQALACATAPAEAGAVLDLITRDDDEAARDGSRT